MLLFQPAAAKQDCLFSATEKADDPKDDCLDLDTTRLKEQPSISAAITGVKLKPTQVYFYRCSLARYSTRVVQERPLKIGITLPKEASTNEFIAPIAHELGHAMQLSEISDLEDLRKKFATAELELGADYIAGYLIRWVMGLTDRASFQRNLETIGDYNREIADWHGCPEHRLAAFRSGFYERNNAKGLFQAYMDFLTIKYPEEMGRC